jgi:acyl dehydratase
VTAPLAPPCVPLEKGRSASFRAVIDEAMVQAFADLSGDRNPLHLDEEHAGRTAFGRRIAHGMIAGALFSRLVGMHLPGERALYRSQRLRFLVPIPLGAEVEVRGEVVDLDRSLSLLKLRTTVAGGGGSPLYVEGEAEVLLRGGAEAPGGGLETAAGQEAGSPEGVEARPRSPRPPSSSGGESGAAAAGEKPLLGRLALVVGGSRGIGAAVSRELALRGASLRVGYHADPRAAERVCEEARAWGASAAPLRLDLRDAEGLGSTSPSTAATGPSPPAGPSGSARRTSSMPSAARWWPSTR